MKEIVGVLFLSLALLVPGQIVSAASEDEIILQRLEKLEKQVQMLKAQLKVKQMGGKKMAPKNVKGSEGHLDTVDKELDNLQMYFELYDEAG